MRHKIDSLLDDITASRTFKRVGGVSFLGIVDQYNQQENARRPSFSRADHSRGVLRLGAKAAEAARMSLEDAAYLLVACLVHDLGHPPFSHSLEYAFPKAARALNHHRVLLDILTEPIGNEREVPRILAKHGISARRVYEIVDGTDPLSFFFSSPINIDTLDGISRSMRSFGFFQKYDIVMISHYLGLIWSGASISDRRFFENADAFWADKGTFYKFIGSENNFARIEWNFQLAVRRHIPRLTRAHFRMTDAEFRLRYPEIISESINGYALHEPTGDMQEFVVNDAVSEVDKNTINHRYIRKRYEIRRRAEFA